MAGPSTNAGQSRSPSPPPEKKPKDGSRKRRRKRSPSPHSSSNDESEAEEDQRGVLLQKTIKKQRAELARLRQQVKGKKKQKKRRQSPSSSSNSSSGSDSEQDQDDTTFSLGSKHAFFRTTSEKKTNKWDLPDDLASYLNEHICQKLTKEELDSISIPKPCPSNAFVERANDTYINTKLRQNELQKSKDQSYTSIQQRIATILGPLGKLWTQFYNSTVDKPLCLDEVLHNVEQSMILVGQSINYVLYQRRWNALSMYYDKKEDIKTLLETHQEEFDKEEKYLLGDKFQKQVIETNNSSRKVETALARKPKKRKQNPFPESPRSSHSGRGRKIFFKKKEDYWKDYRSNDRDQPKGKVFTNKHSLSQHRKTSYSPLSHKRKRKLSPSTHPTPLSGKNCPSTSGRKNKILPPKLATSNERSKNPRHCERMEDTSTHKAKTKETSKTLPLISSGKIDNRPRGSSDAEKRSNLPRPSYQGRIFKQYLCHPKKGQPISSRYKFKKFKPNDSISKVQNGRPQKCEGDAAEERLHGQNRPQRRLLQCCTQQTVATPSKVSVERESLPVPLTLFRHLPSTTDFHQNYENPDFYPEASKHQGSNIFGRHNTAGENSKRDKNSKGDHNLSSAASGICHKSQKILPRPLKGNGILGCSDKFSSNDTISPRNQGDQNNKNVPKIDQSTSSDSSRVVKPDRYPSINSPSNSSSSSAIQIPTTPSESFVSKMSRLRQTNLSKPPKQNRTAVVDSQPPGPQRQSHSDPSPTPNSDLRCGQKRGLGSILPRGVHRGAMEPRRAKSTYQCTGTPGGKICTEVLPEGQTRPFNPHDDRQHNCSIIPCKNGGYKEPHHDKNQQINLAFSVEEKSNSNGRMDSISGKQNFRLGVETRPRFKRVETLADYVSQDLSSLGHISSRSVCLPPQQPVKNLLQLEKGSICIENRCIPTGLARKPPLRLPTLCPHRESPPKSKTMPGRIDSHHTLLAEPDMVQHPPCNDSCKSNKIKTTKIPVNRSSGKHSPIGEKSSTNSSGMENFRKTLANKGISKRAAFLISCSRREGTTINYESSWRKFHSWCNQQNVDPFRCPVTFIIEFLTNLYEAGLAYRTINNHRSAISAYHEKLEGVPVGQNALVCQLMHGISNKRPPQPRYTCIWDVQQVLDYLQKLPSFDQISLQHLTLKVTGLLALAQANRGSELKYLDIDRMRVINNSYVFYFCTPLKNSKKGKITPVMTFHAFPNEKDTPPNERKLCPFTTIEHYLNRTQNLRGVSKKTQLLIGQIKPHNEVQKSTIAGWLKLLLQKAGIDVNIYKAHSFRSASSSKAHKSGVPIEDSLKTGNWSNASTWQKFYHKTIVSSSQTYQQEILGHRL